MGARRKDEAFTFVEMMVLTGVFCILLLLLIPWISRSRARAQRIRCVSYQRQIILGMKQWAIDEKIDRGFPMQVSATNGGTMEWIGSSAVWPHFQVMSNELNTPTVLVCPADRTRVVATAFAPQLGNSNVSYFLGVDATDTQPNAFLLGDSNLTLNGTNLPSGLVCLTTNSLVGWTGARHGNQGNVGLADGSVQGFSNLRLREGLQVTGMTNRLVLP